MAWFKKKRDPISERARALNKQIAALESQIAKLAAQSQAQEPAAEEPVAAPVPAPTPSQPPPEHRPPPQAQAEPRPQAEHRPPSPGGHARLRSTALPHGPTIITSPASPAPPPAPGAPEVFEEVPRNPFKESGEAPAPPQHFNELGVRKYNLAAFWQRLTNHFRGPATSNPKLVNYLAAGSIQGLRPLRYEKRVARNRFIVLVVGLALVLWGLVALFLRH